MTTTPSGSPAPAPNAPFSAMLRGALLPSVAAGLVAVVVLWALRQSTGGLAALLGVAVAVVFFAAGLYVMKRVVGANPLSVLAGALAVYLGQIIFLGVIILVLVRRELAGRHGLRPRDPGGRPGLAGLPGGRLPADAPGRVRRAVVRLGARVQLTGQTGPGAPAPGRPDPGEPARRRSRIRACTRGGSMRGWAANRGAGNDRSREVDARGAGEACRRHRTRASTGSRRGRPW